MSDDVLVKVDNVSTTSGVPNGQIPKLAGSASP